MSHYDLSGRDLTIRLTDGRELPIRTSMAAFVRALEAAQGKPDFLIRFLWESSDRSINYDEFLNNVGNFRALNEIAKEVLFLDGLEDLVSGMGSTAASLSHVTG